MFLLTELSWWWHNLLIYSSLFLIFFIKVLFWNVWFCRTKLKQTEVDCEYLKRCCETLTEENRRLQKELQELRALKTTQPFYMQLPATTLTMCPSCERVATNPCNNQTNTNKSRILPFSNAQAQQHQAQAHQIPSWPYKVKLVHLNCHRENRIWDYIWPYIITWKIFLFICFSDNIYDR